MGVVDAIEVAGEEHMAVGGQNVFQAGWETKAAALIARSIDVHRAVWSAVQREVHTHEAAVRVIEGEQLHVFTARGVLDQDGDPTPRCGSAAICCGSSASNRRCGGIGGVPGRHGGCAPDGKAAAREPLPFCRPLCRPSVKVIMGPLMCLLKEHDLMRATDEACKEVPALGCAGKAIDI